MRNSYKLYCWTCAKKTPSLDKECVKCERIYHIKCIGKENEAAANFICNECDHHSIFDSPEAR